MLPALLAEENPDHIIGVRLLSLEANSEALNAWAPGLPLELVMTDPAAEFPLLYRHTNLLDNHPVRVMIPVHPRIRQGGQGCGCAGFRSAVGGRAARSGAD
jgi:hypothetical protein